MWPVNWLKLSSIGVALFLAGCYKHEISVIRIENCAVVTLGPMMVNEVAERPAFVGDQLQFRRVPESESAFMVAAATRQFRTYSAQRFVFDLADPSRARPATPAEWVAATPVESFQKSATQFRRDLDTLTVIEYKAASFPREEGSGLINLLRRCSLPTTGG